MPIYRVRLTVTKTVAAEVAVSGESEQAVIDYLKQNDDWRKDETLFPSWEGVVSVGNIHQVSEIRSMDDVPVGYQSDSIPWGDQTSAPISEHFAVDFEVSGGSL